MDEKKYFILNEFGEAVRVTREQYLEHLESKGQETQSNDSADKFYPTFKTPEQQETRRKVIDNAIESMNQSELTPDEMTKIEDNVNIGNRERLDDDIKSFQTSEQQEALEGRDAEIENIINMLNELQLSEDEMHRIENEVERVNESENTDEKAKQEEKKEDGRE